MTPKKVLVVDDSATIRTQLASALEKHGFLVVEAGDGLQGLQAARTNELNMVILDVNMPMLGGLEMLERLRSEPKTATLPVLMLTTEVQKSLMQRAKSLGAKGWLIKPVKLDQLVGLVEKLAS